MHRRRRFLIVLLCTSPWQRSACDSPRLALSAQAPLHAHTVHMLHAYAHATTHHVYVWRVCACHTSPLTMCMCMKTHISPHTIHNVHADTYVAMHKPVMPERAELSELYQAYCELQVGPCML